MFVALGVGAYQVAIFHLFTHAFFKALLFLGSGSVIHAMSDEQDIQKMGGLYKIIPFTWIMMLIGTLALTGAPLLSGYYSKDAIIESAFVSHAFGHEYAFYLLVFSACYLFCCFVSLGSCSVCRKLGGSRYKCWNFIYFCNFISWSLWNHSWWLGFKF